MLSANTTTSRLQVLIRNIVNPAVTAPRQTFATMAATANGTQTSVHVNGTSGGVAEPKIHLYTNHRCPYAHRAHITLEELGLDFEETIIDLDTPRPQW